MKRYPEYFIGGPLDGQDKSVRFPMHPEWMQIETTDKQWMWRYYPRKVRLGGVVLTYWADERLMSHEVVAMRFWELMLEPHEIKVQLTRKEVSA